MSKQYLLWAVLGVAAIAIVAYVVSTSMTAVPEPTESGEAGSGPAGEAPPTSPGEVFCTMEAKLCPDGSSVGRVGPNCEFAPCPGTPEPTPTTDPYER